ncbi:MAG: helix-turn-helix transcriptional regulator [Firmicutes bacterium]|nr:helix-turn-helix transcriptional regulator [Bacillota bacterium]
MRKSSSGPQRTGEQPPTAGETFGKRLKSLRKSAGLNQGDLAEKLNVSRSSISSYENIDRMPDIEILRDAAAFFDVSADWLIGLSEVRQGDPKKDALIAELQDRIENIRIVLDHDVEEANNEHKC